MEIFLKYSLEGIPKKILIIDGHMMYLLIIERICIKHQLCIFHIIKHHKDKSYKKINKIKRRIGTLERKIEENEERITKLKEYSHYKKSHWFAIIFSSCLLMTFLSIHLILFILILFIAPSTVR